MPAIKEPERITLAEGLALVERYLPPDQAKARVLRAFVQKALEQEPVFALPYDEAEIDWATGSVKIPRKRERFYPTFRRAEFERYFFEIAAMTSPMTDAEIRGRLLKHIYELRNNNDGWVPTSDIILSPEQVSRRAISNACQQLADAGYIQWHPFNPPIEQLAIGRAKITGPGVDIVTGARMPTLDIRFPNMGERDVSAAPVSVPKEPPQPEVPNALPGARTGFAPEEAPADTVMQRPPNLVLNQSSVAGPPPQTQYDTSLPPVGPKRGSADLLTATVSGNLSASEAAASMTPEALPAAASLDLSPTTASLALSPTPPAMEIASAFEAIQERIRVLEIAFSRMPPPPAGLGHNNPPEPIQDIPLSAAEWAETGQSLAVLKEQIVVPAHEPIEAKGAASRLKVIGGNVLSFLGRHSEEFSSEFAKKAGATAGVVAPGAVVYVLANYGEASLKTFATDLIEVHNLVEAWVHLLGF